MDWFTKFTSNNSSYNNDSERYLAAACWNGQILVYFLNTKDKCLDFKRSTQLPDPIISISWYEKDFYVFFGTGGGHVGFYDISSDKINIIDNCNSPICKVIYCKKQKILMQFSFDGNFKSWEAGYNGAFQIKKQMSMKWMITNVDYRDEMLAIVFCDKIYLNTISEFLQKTQYGLTDQDLTTLTLGENNIISTIVVGPKQEYNSQKIMFGTDTGRCLHNSLEKQSYNNSPYKISNLITFRTTQHVISKESSNSKLEETYLYPLSSASYLKKSKVFLLTASGNGKMCFWDVDQKEKIQEFDYGLSSPITTVKFDENEDYLAYALGYNWQQGIDYVNNYEQPKIFVHQMSQSELKKK